MPDALSSQAILHLGLHAVVPGAVAVAVYRRAWAKNYLIMLATMAIDVDHLLGDPIYDPTRCSMGFHPLHTTFPVLLYVAALLHPKTRVVGMGLCIHMLLDGVDCGVTSGLWFPG